MISELIHICVRLWLSGGSGAVQFGPKGAEKKAKEKDKRTSQVGTRDLKFGDSKICWNLCAHYR